MVTAKSIWELCYYDCIKHVTCQRTLYLALGEAMRCEVKAQCRAVRSGLNSSPEKKKDDHLVWDLQTLTFDPSFTRKQVFEQDHAWLPTHSHSWQQGVLCVFLSVSVYLQRMYKKLYNAIQHHNYGLKGTYTGRQFIFRYRWKFYTENVWMKTGFYQCSV